MQSEKLARAVGAIHVRFGSQALVRAGRAIPAPSWPTGQPAVDRLSGIGGLPRGRVTVLRGGAGSGKLTLALALLARATREHARAVVIDRLGRFDPWIPDRMGADLGALVVVRPPGAAAAGEAAVALARAGAGFVLVLDDLPEPALAALASAASRSGCLLLAVDGPRWPAEDGGHRRALAHAASLTLELERRTWVRERSLVTGVRSAVRCVKNKLAAPGVEAELRLRFPLAPLLPATEEPEAVTPEAVEDETCGDASAAG